MNDTLREIAFAKHQVMLDAEAAFEAGLKRLHPDYLHALVARYATEQATPELTQLRDAYHQAAEDWRVAYRAAVGIPEETTSWT